MYVINAKVQVERYRRELREERRKEKSLIPPSKKNLKLEIAKIKEEKRILKRELRDKQKHL